MTGESAGTTGEAGITEKGGNDGGSGMSWFSSFRRMRESNHENPVNPDFDKTRPYIIPIDMVT